MISAKNVRRDWTRNELILAFNLYCRIPFGRIHNRNPEIIELATKIGRSPSAVSWKLANLARLDPTLAKRDIKGATHGSKQDEQIWREFEGNWEGLAFESEMLRRNGFESADENVAQSLEDTSIDIFPEGKTRDSIVRLRVNQSFFRNAVLSAYRFKCCITGIDVPELLTASHIIPWSENIPNRTNPQNGLCLNALHDRAFDRGLITITDEFRVRISPQISSRQDQELKSMLLSYEGSSIQLPDHFVPSRDFLQYHRDNKFKH